MMKIKKLSVVILAGMLACTAPMPVMASESSAEELLIDNAVDTLASDPEKAVDVIMYAKNLIDQQDISDETIYSAIDTAAEQLNIILTDGDRDSLFKVVKKVKEMDIDEDQLRGDVNKVYNKLKEIGVEKEDVKNILQKAVDFVKGLFA